MTITVKTDKKFYAISDTVHISGTVDVYYRDSPISIRLTSPSGNVAGLIQCDVNRQQQFKGEIKLNPASIREAGIYTVRCLYGNESNIGECEFELLTNTADKTTKELLQDFMIKYQQWVLVKLHFGVLYEGKPFFPIEELKLTPCKSMYKIKPTEENFNTALKQLIDLKHIISNAPNQPFDKSNFKITTDGNTTISYELREILDFDNYDKCRDALDKSPNNSTKAFIVGIIKQIDQNLNAKNITKDILTSIIFQFPIKEKVIDFFNSVNVGSSLPS